jgi:hypothetical protein
MKSQKILHRSQNSVCNVCNSVQILHSAVLLDLCFGFKCYTLQAVTRDVCASSTELQLVVANSVQDSDKA